ncbi:DNA primase [Loigolactobacillus zhaoyuanensis]|uniref:DNA primase n=1 Tax=Loigolactobacillus zhaoyuanensis TaxID=2486017 RepID=A0ABW8UGE6_9LACO|nr:DNA primase [Loigolactobacillus zhaoyuanensis]
MATRIPEDVVEQIRGAVNITDVVGQYVQLKKSGRNLFGLCPFHEERTPSFSVTEDKQIFHCFSCGRGGNVFKFIMEVESLSFPEAVTRVAELGHVDIDLAGYDTQSHNEPAPNSQQQQLRQLYQDAAALFHHILLNTKLGETALAYTQQRQLSAELLATFDIGYAPNERDLLTRFFAEKKVDFNLLRHSGLFIENNDGTLRDRFFDRVMFPIKDAQGNVIAFSGRALTKREGQPKYLNSPETELFNKRDVLFNFDVAKAEIRKAKQVILFEGFMDVIAAYRAGITYGVASMGTSLTNEQLYLLQRTTDHLVVCYDGDLPGLKATDRVIELLHSDPRFQLSIVTLPEQLDPDEYVNKYGAERFQQIINGSMETAVGFRLRYLKQGRNLDNEQDKLTYIDAALHELVNVSSAVERDIYLNRLSESLQVTYEALATQLQDYLVDATTTRRSAPQPRRETAPMTPQVHQQQTKLTRTQRAERGLLNLYFKAADVRIALNEQADFQFVHEAYQAIYQLAIAYFAKHDQFVIAQFMDQVTDNQLQSLVIAIDQQAFDEATVTDQFQDYLHALQQAGLERQLDAAQAQLQEASRSGDSASSLNAVQTIIRLKRQMQPTINTDMV